MAQHLKKLRLTPKISESTELNAVFWQSLPPHTVNWQKSYQHLAGKQAWDIFMPFVVVEGKRNKAKTLSQLPQTSCKTDTLPLIPLSNTVII